jgi:hypothetical protein
VTPNLVLSRLAFSLSLVFFILSTITSHLWQLLSLCRCPSRFGSRAIYSELSLIDGRISFSLTNRGIFPPHHFHQYTQQRVIEYLQPSTLLYQQLLHFNMADMDIEMDIDIDVGLTEDLDITNVSAAPDIALSVSHDK